MIGTRLPLRLWPPLGISALELIENVRFFSRCFYFSSPTLLGMERLDAISDTASLLLIGRARTGWPPPTTML